MKRQLILLITVLLFSACAKDKVIRGGGPSTIENRTQISGNNFTSIKISGSTDAEIVYGAEYKLEVSGYSNLLDALSTEVTGNTLYIGFNEHYNVKNDNTKVRLVIPFLPNLQLNGAIETSVSGIFPAQESLYFRINGSGEINAEGANSNLTRAEYSIYGSGNIRAYDLISKTAEADISGSGTIKTSVFQILDVSISGSGNCYYKGNPTVSTQISGSGRVLRVN